MACRFDGATVRLRAPTKTRLDLILDRVEASEREVTIDTDGYTKEQLDRIIATARARGLHTSYDGRFVLVRKMSVDESARRRPPFAQHRRGRVLSPSTSPRLTRVSAKPGMRVRVAESDSMYRGMEGTIVMPDPSRTVQLGNYERFLLREGAVLVEHYNGELLVVPPSHLERST